MGYNRSEIEESLANAKYDDVFATYLLLGRKSSDVSTSYTCMYVDILFSVMQQKGIMRNVSINR
jgi:3'-phosphoadenosine 5'-phosphosulfate sulfotransferase